MIQSQFALPLRLSITFCLLSFVFIFSSISSANQTLSFNGQNSYVAIPSWQASGDFRLIVYFGQLNPNADARTILLSSSISNEFLGFAHHMVQGQWGQDYPGIWNQFNFQQTGYLEILVEQGQLTISDGMTQAQVQNSAINPTAVSYDRLMRRGEQDFAQVEVQAVILLDLATPQNSRAYGFDPEHGLLVIGEDSANGQLHGIQTADYSAPRHSIINPDNRTFTEQDWQRVFPSTHSSSTSAAQQQTLSFDGQRSYAQIPLWQPNGAFRVVAWLTELNSDPTTSTYLLSHSGTTEHLSFSHRDVQIKQGNHFPGLWDQFDFIGQKYVDITIENGKLSASDGVSRASVSHASIQPHLLQYDWLYRRGGGYSPGALQAISLIDLTKPSNSRSYRFDSEQGLLELTGNDGQLIAVDPEHWGTTARIPNNPAPEHFEQNQWLTFYQPPLPSSSAEPEITPEPPVNADPTPPMDSNVPSTSNELLLPAHFQAVQFHGQGDYLALNWQPENEHRVVAWFSELTFDGDQWHYLLSGDNSYLAFNQHDIKVRLNGVEFEMVDRFAFSQNRQIAFHIVQGVLTVSDGQNQHSLYDQAISPILTYHSAMRWAEQYSRGTLQSLGLIDYNNPDNTLGYLFDPNQGVVNTRTDEPDQSQLVAVNEQSYIAISQLPHAPRPLLLNQQQWDQQFADAYPNQRPILDNTDGNDKERFDWEGHYWLRAYLTMARTFNDDKYLDYAVELIDHMLAYTDEQRSQRDELDLSITPYASAPKFYLNNPNIPAPSWRRPFGGWRISVLSDGQILSAIMQVVDYIKTHNKTPYLNKADRYLEHTLRVIESHQSSYSNSKNAAIQGSYFYVNNQNAHLGDAGLYSNPLPYNHSMTMGVAMIYAEKWGGANELGLNSKISEIIGFFTDHLRQEGGICQWDYAFDITGKTKLENVNHAHIDIHFLLTAYQEGYLQDDDLLRCIANTLTEQIYMPPVMLHYDVGGTGVSSKYDQVAIGYDWLALAQFQPKIKVIAQHVLHHYGQIYWFRPYLAWAELMALEQQP